MRSNMILNSLAYLSTKLKLWKQGICIAGYTHSVSPISVCRFVFWSMDLKLSPGKNKTTHRGSRVPNFRVSNYWRWAGSLKLMRTTQFWLQYFFLDSYTRTLANCQEKKRRNPAFVCVLEGSCTFGQLSTFIDFYCEPNHLKFWLNCWFPFL